MSSRRAPQPTHLTVSQSLSNSQSDLSKTSDDEGTRTQAALRKRKQRDCCDVRTELSKFREEIVSLLQTNLALLRDEFSAIKTQISDIKETTNKMLADQNDMKADILLLKKDSSATKSMLSTLEATVESMESKQSKDGTSEVLASEKIINELQERAVRSKNLIIVGLPEQTATENSARQFGDKKDAQETLQSVVSKNYKIIKTLRLGKYTPGKNRPLKVFLENQFEVREILRNRNKLSDKLKIYSDQTPTQKIMMQELSQELNRRKNNGEVNLTIKYVKGIPKIVKTHPKN